MIISKPVIGIALGLTLATADAAVAGTKRLTLNWNELGSAVENRQVTVVLSRGVRLSGMVAEVRPETLRMALNQSSDKKAYPPGEVSIAREEVTEIRIKEVKGPGRLIGAAGLGAGASLGTLGWAISDSRVNVADSTRITQWTAITAGAVVGGYLVGRWLDTNTTVIRVAKAK
ncbi:MAG: hypothetical protein ACKV22_29375 [Bryobacteraceae bacterium]